MPSRLLGVIDILLASNCSRTPAACSMALCPQLLQEIRRETDGSHVCAHTHQLATLIGAARSHMTEKRCMELAVIVRRPSTGL